MRKKQEKYDFGQDWAHELARQWHLRKAQYEYANPNDGNAVVSMKLATSREFELLLIGIAGRLAEKGDLVASRMLWAHMQATLPHIK